MTFKLAEQLLKQVKRVDPSPLLKFNNGSQYFILPLARITINFSETMVDSQGVRDFLLSPTFHKFVQQNPSIEFIIEPREGRRPVFRATYNLGVSKPGQDYQRCVCLAMLDPKTITSILNELRQESGQVRRRFEPQVHSETPAVRPVWSPFHHNVEHNNALHRLKEVVAKRAAEEAEALTKSLGKLPITAESNPTVVKMDIKRDELTNQ